MKHYGDITKIKGSDVPIVDIVTGGSPCQDLSVAGKRAGLDGERSGLFMEQIRVFREMRDAYIRQLRMRGADINIRFIRPRFFVWENVPGAFSSNKGEDFRCVLEEVCRIADKTATVPMPEKGKWSTSGCIMGDGWSVAWRVHDAQFWGVPQRRKRISLVADFGGTTAPEILFERKGLSGDIKESREQGQGITADIERSVEKTDKCLNSWDVQSKHIQPENGIAEALYAGECRYAGGESYVLQNKIISFQERAGKPGGGKEILIQNKRTGALSTLNKQSVCYGLCSYDSNSMKSSNPHSGIYEADTSRTLDLNGGNPACNQGGIVVVQDAVCIENHPADSRVKISEDGVVQTLSSRMGTGGGNVPMVMESINGEISGTLDASYYKGCGERQGVEREVIVQTYQNTTGTLSPGAHAGSYNGQDAYNDMLIAAVDCRNGTENPNTNGTIQAKENGGQSLNYQNTVRCGETVRRLTPLECERLQGYPDHWTDIGEWIDSKGKKHKDADSPRYKALGNSIALPFWQWMAERMIKELDVTDPTMASLFDGIGGFPLVFSRCGCEPVWASEIEEFPIAVTKERFPE